MKVSSYKKTNVVLKEKEGIVFLQMKFMRYILCLLLCIAVLFSPLAAPAGEFGALRFVPLTIGDDFSCEIPADWSIENTAFGLSQEEKKAYGVKLQGPWNGEIPVKISVYYYANGNLLYKSVDHYLRLFSQPALGVALEGSIYGPVVPATVSGRKALAFERLKNEYVPIRNGLGPLDKPAGGDARVYEKPEMMARPVPIRERFVVLPAESGFYTLRYSAPVENFKEFLPIFEKVTATFYAMR